MKILRYILPGILILLSGGCQKTDVIEIDLDYKEYTVIRSEVKSDEEFQGVSVTKTLPVGVKYDIVSAEITDAFLYIRVNGVQVIPLHYSGDGIYKTRYKISIKPGNTYELFGKANGREFYSKTKAPQKPNIISSSNSGNQFYEASVNPNEGEVYGAVWASSSERAEDFYSIEGIKTKTYEPILIRTQTLPVEYQGPSPEQRYIQVFSFDEAYLPYFQTKGQNRPVEDAFAQGGNEISWNVVGENVIGLFMGVAEGDKYEVH